MYDNLTDQQLTDLCFDLSNNLSDRKRQLKSYCRGDKTENKEGWLYRLHCSIESMESALNIASCEIRRRENKFNETLLDLIEKRIGGEGLDILVLEARAICDGRVH